MHINITPTHQATTIMAASAQERAAAAAAAPPGAPPPPRLPSLVVCPATLVGHWGHEIGRYVDDSYLRPLEIAGSPADRRAAAGKLLPGGYSVAVMSYESLRSEAEWAAGVEWDYVILDEGHVIRSSKSRLAQVVKRLRCDGFFRVSRWAIEGRWGLQLPAESSVGGLRGVGVCGCLQLLCCFSLFCKQACTLTFPTGRSTGWC